jgi:hypothetical protein
MKTKRSVMFGCVVKYRAEEGATPNTPAQKPFSRRKKYEAIHPAEPRSSFVMVSRMLMSYFF